MRRVMLGIFVITEIIAAGIAPAHAGHGDHGRDGAFQVRLGGFSLRGGGQVWEDNEAFFDLDASKFDDGVVGVSFVNALGNHLEIGVNADFFDSATFSAVSGVVDPLGVPIVHETRLKITPITLDFRVLPGGRSRHGSRGLKPVPYFGAGIGLVRWRYSENGEFVDFSDPALPIFAGDFEADGIAFESHLLAGVEMPLSRFSSFLVEARHTWADDQLDSTDFPDFGRLELGGSSLYIGAAFRF